MTDLRLEDFEGLRAWATHWLKYEGSYSIKAPEVEINFLGAEEPRGDRGSLLIDVYQENSTCIEYLFLAENEKDEERCMILIFDFLQHHHYSLKKVLDYLAATEFIETEEKGASISFHGLLIKKDIFAIEGS